MLLSGVSPDEKIIGGAFSQASMGGPGEQSAPM
jgi:hypothetical protein